jgi:hypothetical protein
MLKILKNNRIDFDTNEYIIFDCIKKEMKKEHWTPSKAKKLSEMMDIEPISPMVAYAEKLFDFKEVEKIDYPLPF